MCGSPAERTCQAQTRGQGAWRSPKAPGSVGGGHTQRAPQKSAPPAYVHRHAVPASRQAWEGFYTPSLSWECEPRRNTRTREKCVALRPGPRCVSWLSCPPAPPASRCKPREQGPDERSLQSRYVVGAELFQQVRAQEPRSCLCPQELPAKRENPFCDDFLPHQDTEMQNMVFLTLPQWPFACLKKSKKAPNRP